MVPFHSEKARPEAPCPRCTNDRNDSSPKEMYAIKGLRTGEYDPAIPAEWIKCPPIRLDGSVPGMEAVQVSVAIDVVKTPTVG